MAVLLVVVQALVDEQVVKLVPVEQLVAQLALVER